MRGAAPQTVGRAAECEVIQSLGTHPVSNKEMPMALEAMGLGLLCVGGTDTEWLIRTQRQGSPTSSVALSRAQRGHGSASDTGHLA